MNSKNTIDFLKSLELFSDFNDYILNFLCENSKIQYYNDGEILYYEKETNKDIFFIVNGALKFYKVDRFDNEIFLYKLGKKSLVFDVSQFSSNNMTCYANAEFVKDSEVIIFDGEKFKELLQEDRKVSQKIFQEALLTIDQLQCIISRDVVFDGTAKVAHMLSNELETFNTLKKHEIAYMLHIQPETLSRILKKLARNEIISIEKNKVIVLSEEELKEIYE